MGQILIALKNIQLSTNNKPLIKGGRVILERYRKKAIIGRNGCGKSSLIKIIYSLIVKKPIPDYLNFSAETFFLKNITIGYLPQSVQLTFKGTIEEFIDTIVGEKAIIYKKFQEVEKQLTHPSAKILKQYGQLLELMEKYNLWNYSIYKKRLINDLNIDKKILKNNLSSLSGGEAVKIALLSNLLKQPDILFLDEPTNYLDEDKIKLLSYYIKRIPSTVLLVSHDREFLDNTIDSILEINEEDLSIHNYGGNYSFYKQKKDQEFKTRSKLFEAQQKKIKKLYKSMLKLNKQAKEIQSGSNNAFLKNKGAKLSKTASRIKKRVVEEIKSQKEVFIPKKPAFVVIDDVKYSNKRTIIDIDNISFYYKKNTKYILKNFSLTVQMGEKIAIIGKNGKGKTTLLKLITGELKPVIGKITIKARFAYLPQNIEIKKDQNLVDFFLTISPTNFEKAKKTLGKVLFTDASLININDLSLGDLKKVYLAAIFASAPDLIILDEPTTHLDVFTIEMLEEALNKFKGSLIIVSHDKRLLNNIKGKPLTL